MKNLAFIQNVDIYLLDQILKGNYQENDIILDAGCGGGRNLKWFAQHNFNLFAIDVDQSRIEETSKLYPKVDFKVGEVSELPYKNNEFHHVICSAVLHFAESTEHFLAMFAELIRVLKPNGTLFIRMTTNVGVEQTARPLKNGVYHLKDDTNRFLITKELFQKVVEEHNLQLIEPFKTTVVEDVRSMATLVLQKKQK